MVDPVALAGLTEMNVDDVLRAFDLTWASPVLRPLVRPRAGELARQLLLYDTLVGEVGLQTAAAWLLGRFVRGSVVEHQNRVPHEGPLLLVSNHPGLYDTLALFTAIPRPDLRIIAADRAFLRALPNTCRHLLLFDDVQGPRTRLLREATRHLRSGGALLLFPGGHIEPDPASMPGAISGLREWSASIELFARLVPELAVLPAVVSGVLAKPALHHPLVRLRRDPVKRDLLASTMQLVLPHLHTLPVRVAFGPVLHRQALSRAGDSALVPAVLAATARLMQQAAQ